MQRMPKITLVLLALGVMTVMQGQTLKQSGDPGYVETAKPFQVALLINDTDTTPLMFAICYHAHDRGENSTGDGCRIYDVPLSPGESMTVEPLSAVEGRQRFSIGAWLDPERPMVAPAMVDMLRIFYSEQLAAVRGDKNAAGTDHRELREIARAIIAEQSTPGPAQGQSGAPSRIRLEAIVKLLGEVDKASSEPIAKSQALDADALGFTAIYPPNECEEWRISTGSLIVAECHHRAYCKTKSGAPAPKGSSALYAGLQARTDCFGYVVYAYSTAHFKSLMANASIRNPLGFNVVPAAYSLHDCNGLRWEFGGGGTQTCYIW